MKIVQIGANKGNTDNDPVWKLCQENLPDSQNWELLFVEPNMKALKILRDNYTNAGFYKTKFLQIAASYKSDILTLYLDHDNVAGSEGSQHCSLYKDHMHKMGHSDAVISTALVSSLALDDILKIANGSVDYLQIDTEGHDFAILLGCNLKEFDVKKIEYEHLHISADNNNLVNNYLNSCGYHLVNKNHEDSIYEKN